MVRAPWGQVRAPVRLAWLQVRRAERRAASAHQRKRRADRGRRLRLPDRATVPASLYRSVRRPARRVHPGATGLPGLGAGAVLPAAVLLVQVLLRGLPAVAQRTRRG